MLVSHEGTRETHTRLTGSAQIILNLLNGERRAIHSAHCLAQLPRPSTHTLIAEQTVQNIAHIAAAHIILRKAQGVTVAHALLNIPALLRLHRNTGKRHTRQARRLYRPLTAVGYRGINMAGEQMRWNSPGNSPGEMDIAAQHAGIRELHPAADQHIHRSG